MTDVVSVGTVTAMRREVCSMCDGPFEGPAYVVDVAIKYPKRRRWTRARLRICGGCYAAGFDPVTGYQIPAGRTKERILWQQVVGRGEQMPPTPCAHCGLMVIRNSDPLLKHVTCSGACAASLTRSRNGNKGTGKPCEVCGTPIITGRADSVTCSPACRQKAYRQRKTSERPPETTKPRRVRTAGQIIER